MSASIFNRYRDSVAWVRHRGWGWGWDWGDGYLTTLNLEKFNHCGFALLHFLFIFLFS